MSGSLSAPAPPLNPVEMQVLIARAGLTLNPGQVADLVLAWRQIVGLLGLIPRDRPLLDDQAFVFRLPPPAAPVAAPRGRVSAPPTAKKAASRTAKKTAPRTGKKAATATRKAAASHTGKKAAARKTVRGLSSGGPAPAHGAGRGARPRGRR